MSPRASKTPSPAQPVGQKRTTRCLVVGNCDGLPELLEALHGLAGIEVVRSKDGATAIAKGGAEVILHATNGKSEWIGELTSIRDRKSVV